MKRIPLALLAFVIAAGITVYAKNTSAARPAATYTIVDLSHPYSGSVYPVPTINAYCPGGIRLCAVNVANGNDMLKWNGGGSKY